MGFDKMAAYLFHEGNNFTAYNYLGANKTSDGYVFRVFAPCADRIFLVGDFNRWEESTPMRKITASGIWETVVYADIISPGDKYKYKIYRGSLVSFKADPYAKAVGKLPESASVIDRESTHEWRDEGWLEYRRKNAGRFLERPMNIYELHLGSFMHTDDGVALDYVTLAHELAPYVKQMGYTHIEMLPIMEYDSDASAGYSSCCFFAPTSRYGDADGLREFIDCMHEAGIGVIISWSPTHFSRAEHGLARFDSSAVYECDGAGYGGYDEEFDLGRAEVRSFLISCADYWIREFHADGLFTFVDPVCAERLQTQEFLKKLNGYLKAAFTDVLSIVEDTGAYLRATGFEDGGLGFDLRWNIGWMRETLSYASSEYGERQNFRSKLISPTSYSFSENYVLPYPQREMIAHKRSFLDKMPGEYRQKFAAARAFMGYAITQLGKKLSFMGAEIGQFCEWQYDKACEWFLLEYDMHAKLQRYAAELNHFYLSRPELWQADRNSESFYKMRFDDYNRDIISFCRSDGEGRELIVLINFTPDLYENFLLGAEKDYSFCEVFNSDCERFGGGGALNTDELFCTGIAAGGCSDSIKIKVAPLSMIIFEKRSQPQK